MPGLFKISQLNQIDQKLYIGREEELVFLLKSMAEFKNSASLLLVEGQAGIGKTSYRNSISPAQE